jgi:hypothetical protein
MTNDNPRRRVLRRAGYFSACLFLVGMIVCLIVGFEEARRAERLRKDVCQLELGKSTFSDVSRIFPRYTGYAPTFDNVPSSCSPEYCYYILYVENSISRVIPIFPRAGLFATVRISQNTLTARAVGIDVANGQSSNEAFVQQSTDSHFKEDTRIISESKGPRKGAAVPFENPARFVELANELRLRCLVLPGVCSEADDMLPFLRGRKALRGTKATR